MQNLVCTRFYKNLQRLLLFVLLIAPIGVFAEYRVYQYFVKSKHETRFDTEAYQVISTLDPVSYKAYHGGDEAITLDLLRTWTCPGHTGNRRPICPPPEKIEEQQR